MQLCSFFLITFLFKESPKNNTNLHCHFHDEREFHHCFSLCFHHYFLRRYSSKSFFYLRNLKILISLKRHTFSIKYYSHKRYLLIRFILAYIRITKLLKKKTKKNYFQKFIEELDFVELSTQDKHLSVDVTWWLTKWQPTILLLLVFTFSFY